MDKILDTEITNYETSVLIKVIEKLMQNGNIVPSTDDILHELIRLSDIAIKHLK